MNRVTKETLIQLLGVSLIVWIFTIVIGGIIAFAAISPVADLQKGYLQEIFDYDNLQQKINLRTRYLHRDFNSLKDEIEKDQQENRKQIREIKKSLDHITVHVHLKGCCQ